jgi:sucrose-6-phosphate hydrolase SacC (GH32 family)
MKASLFLSVLFTALCSMSAQAADDLLVADFESADYGEWKITGEAFGKGPARGTLPGQMPVDGFLGKGLVNSFVGGDKSTGTLTSPPFKIERRYLSFLIGGGGYSNETCMNLLVDAKVVRSAVGPNVQPGGSERLQSGGWDVSEFAGRDAVIQIVDQRAGGWGHINVDQIVQTDRKPPSEQKNVTREIAIAKDYLHFPVKAGATRKRMEVLRGGKVERWFEIDLADGEPDWWAYLDVTAWRGEKLTLKVDRLRDDSRGLESISNDHQMKLIFGGNDLYHEPLRPQFHFSAMRGWINDPNGLVFYRGEYHMFFQHDPFSWNGGAKHWGHAISQDLIHWREVDEALYPDSLGQMWSGSAVVDWKNTSGFGKNGEPPVVLIYTATGNQMGQCLAFSTDGRTFTKYGSNPVVKQITGGNRDPKVIWHEPSKRWVMTLYVGFDETKDGKKTTRHTIHFLTSPNLKDWKVVSQIDGFFECPDFFELPLDGDTNKRKWVLTAASSEYMVGSFDGEKFTPETPKLPGHRGKGFYAAQTFSDIPASDGRRIQIGWLQAPSPGMPFNQCMSVPLELKLISTSDGPRLTWVPIALPPPRFLNPTGIDLSPGHEMSLNGMTNGLLQVTSEFEPGVDSEVSLSVNGIPVSYNSAKQELVVNGHRAPAPLRNGKQRITILADRTVLEVFASDGLTYVPMPVTAKASGVTATLRGAPLKFQRTSVTELSSIWK